MEKTYPWVPLGMPRLVNEAEDLRHRKMAGGGVRQILRQRADRPRDNGAWEHLFSSTVSRVLFGKKTRAGLVSHFLSI